MHSLLEHEKNPGAHVFDNCGHVLFICGCSNPGHKHSPFTDIVIPSGHKQAIDLSGAPTQMYEHLFDFAQAFVPL